VTDTELWESLDGLFAYDLHRGSIETGIQDDELKQQVKKELQEDAENNYPRVTKFLHEFYTVPPYTIEDTANFIDWLSAEMGISL
jgi:hypothetical protein